MKPLPRTNGGINESDRSAASDTRHGEYIAPSCRVVSIQITSLPTEEAFIGGNGHPDCGRRDNSVRGKLTTDSFSGISVRSLNVACDLSAEKRWNGGGIRLEETLSLVGVLGKSPAKEVVAQ